MALGPTAAHADTEKALEQGARGRQHLALSLAVQGTPAHWLSGLGSASCVSGSQYVVDAQGLLLVQQGTAASVALAEKVIPVHVTLLPGSPTAQKRSA